MISYLADRFHNDRRLFLALLVVALFLEATEVKASEYKKASTSHKGSWSWSVEERLAARFSPDALKARSHVQVVHGKQTPELFLPWELFDQLINLGFDSQGEEQLTARRLIEEHAAALGFGVDIWQRLEASASPFVDLRRAEAKLAKGHSTSPADVVQGQDMALRLCQTRAEAIAAAKAEFGEEQFLRLLYGAVAPTFSRAYVVEGLADYLRYVEGGCQ